MLPSMPTFLSGLLAFAVCAFSLPLALKAASFWQIYDEPGELKIHNAPIPRVGGIAMMAGFVAGIAPLLIPIPVPIAFALVAIVGIWLTGLVDDIRGLPPIFRLLVQLGAGAIL